jgi:3-deoxy-manno-octulosonate cytidylyltransferase (CMP-KDO synthetase)
LWDVPPAKTPLPKLYSSPTVSGRRVVGAIPSRYGSTRLPAKALQDLAGRPMIEHVYRRAARASGLERLVVLTDHEEIRDAVEAFGGHCQMTPEDCASGTDRIAWAARDWPEEAVINIQGDEPLIDPQVIGRLAAHLVAHPEDSIVTFAAPATAAEVEDPNAVKVVLDRRGYALYFSRAAIPYVRHRGAVAPWKHLGIYGYQKRALLQLASLEPSPLECCEGLEQLRALENGLEIRVLAVERSSPGVDTAEDLERVRKLLESQKEEGDPS